jgi:hypothetical protein
VRLWDARSGECIQVIEGSGADVAIAGVAKRYLYMALARGDETILERDYDSRVIARFPAALEHIRTQPASRTWAGAISNHLYLLTLEGDDPCHQTAAT